MKKFRTLLVVVLIALLAMVFVACGEKNGNNQNESFTITFDTQGGSEVKPITIAEGATITLPSNPTKDGYIFDGWYLSDEFIEEFNATQTISSDITVYAKWKEDDGNQGEKQTYTITFDTQGGSEVKPIIVKEGETINLPSNPTRDGYRFEGWYLDPEYVNQFYFYDNVSSNITLYAKWGCEHTPVLDAAVAPTCTETGLTDGSHCSKCNAVLRKQEEISALGHDEQHHNAKEPTCTEVGWDEYVTCSRCDYTTFVEKSALGHNFINKICERCGSKYYSEGLTYRFDTEGNWCIVTGLGTCEDVDIVIPSEINGKPVTNIESEAFACRVNLRSITIPDSVTSMGYDAFGCCSGLISITVDEKNDKYHSKGNCLIETDSKTLILGCKNSVIPTDGSVTSIAHSAFRGCTGLTSITIPDSVVSIGYSTFRGCTGLTSITIPDSVTNIGGSAFDRCTGLTSINGSAKMVSIVAQQSSSTSVVVNITSGDSIGYSAFSGCTGLTSVTIPDSVTSIGDYAFSDCTGLTSVTIGSGVTSIGYMAFYNCTGLTSITIPDTVTSIGYSAFYNCIGLTSISGPANIVRAIASDAKPTSFVVNITSGDSICSEAFYNCTGLTSITIPNSVTSIGRYAFSGCTGLTTVNWNATACASAGSYDSPIFSDCTNLATVNIGENVTIIPSYSFYNCSGLTSVTIGGGVTSIGSSAFYNCSGLTNITIPDSVTSIGDSALKGCSSLESVTIPFVGASNEAEGYKQTFGYIFGYTTTTNYTDVVDNAVYQYGYGTGPFYWYYIPSSLKNVTIGNKATSIASAFFNCSEITSITIGNAVTSIGYNAFFGCSKLTTLNWNAEICNIVGSTEQYLNFGSTNNLETFNVGENVTKISSTLLILCGSLASINVAPANNYYRSSGNCLIETGSKTLVIGCNTSIIPTDGSVTSISDYAFAGRAGLTSIIIPDSVTSIGDYAFSGCTGLTSITIPNSVTSIGGYAFRGCTGLTKVNWNATACIDAGSEGTYHSPIFSGCTNLATVNIGEKVTTIPSWAFYNCTGLTSVTIGNNVTSIGSNAFSGCTGLTNISGPSDMVGTVSQQARPTSFVVNITSRDSIGASAFRGCTGLTSITIPDSVTNIGNSAFDGCTGLTSIVIPDSVTNIGGYVFDGCTGLTSIIIPDSVTSIGDYAFSGCTGLTSITIPNSVTSIGRYAFSGCTGLTSVIIGNGVTSIGDYAFEYCSGLTSITIPDSVTSIGYEAFSGCSGLTNISGPSDMVGTVSRQANVTSFVVNITSGDSIGAGAFSGCTGLMSIIIPDTVTSIGEYAFYGCSGLTSITIPDGVTSIGDYGFSECTGLTSITIPNSVTSIGRYAFSGCTGLTTVNWNATACASAGSLSYQIFKGCTNLTTVNIGENVTTIPSYAFYGCTGLTSITFNGTIEQWSALEKGESWNYNVPSACKVVCTDGEVSI